MMLYWQFKQAKNREESPLKLARVRFSGGKLPRSIELC